MAGKNAARFSYINMFHIRLLFNLLFDVSGFFCSRRVSDKQEFRVHVILLYHLENSQRQWSHFKS